MKGMERIITREISLTYDEIKEAIVYWLTNKLDVQLGDNPSLEFDGFIGGATVSSVSKDSINV